MMNVIRITIMIVNCLRELIFDSREEYDFRSRMFNMRKVLIFVLMFASLVANLIFVNRIYTLAVENVKLKKEIRVMSLKNTLPPPSDSEKSSITVAPDKDRKSG